MGTGVFSTEDASSSPMFVGQISGSVFVVFQLSSDTKNILGVFFDGGAAFECVSQNAPGKSIVISLSDIEALVPDRSSLIATKLHEPEIRIARCPIESESDDSPTAQ